LFDPVAHTEVIVSDDFDQWKAWRERCGDLFSYCKEISMREAQKSLLDAEERLLTATYNTKLCEISLMQISGRINEYLK
jgi:hypothetical protein